MGGALSMAKQSNLVHLSGRGNVSVSCDKTGGFLLSVVYML